MKIVFLGRTEGDGLHLAGHFKIGDIQTIEKMLQQDLVFTVPRGTRAELHGFANGPQHIKVLEGQHEREYGWLPLEFCRTLSEGERRKFDAANAANK